VKAFTRALAWALVVSGMLGIAGCGQDNESTAAKPAGLGDPGAGDPTKATKAAPPSDPGLSQYGKTRTDGYKGTGYPGSKK